jgi:hypothetical protein
VARKAQPQEPQAQTFERIIQCDYDVSCGVSATCAVQDESGAWRRLCEAHYVQHFNDMLLRNRSRMKSAAA